MTYDALTHNDATRPRSLSVGDWFRLFVSDRRILASWLVFAAVGIAYAYLILSQFGAGSAPPADIIFLQSLTAGYLAWSMYWGVPGCLALLRQLWTRIFFGFGFMGCSSIGLFIGIAVVALVYYPPFGGGVFHFLRRWWLSAKHASFEGMSVADKLPDPVVAAPFAMSSPIAVPAVAAPPVAVPPAAGTPIATPSVQLVVRSESRADSPSTQELLPDIEQRLRALEQLHERGLITRDEHDRRRNAILDKIGGGQFDQTSTAAPLPSEPPDPGMGSWLPARRGPAGPDHETESRNMDSGSFLDQFPR